MTRLHIPSRAGRNVVWNLFGGLSSGVLVVVATPWYLARLGLEGYGLLGLWLMMQVMMGLLDLGLGATIVKEFANSGAATDRSARADLLRTMEFVYWLLAAVLSATLIAGAGWVAREWLQVRTIEQDHVARAFRVMSVALGVQFPCALYLNGLAGLQAQGRMNALQVLGNVLRHGVGVAALFWSTDLVWFFTMQTLVAAFQTFLTRRTLWHHASASQTAPGRSSIEQLRRVWRFSAGMAVTASSGLLLANVDRIVLSKMAPTAELGKYTVAFTATGLLQMGIQPFYRALFPRYAELIASRDSAGLQEEYFRSCSWMATLLLPAALVGWAFAPQLFRAWIGMDDPTVVTAFRWLLVGIGASGLTWLPAAFQQAHGWTRLHAAMILGALVIGAPMMIWAIRAFGMVGATAVWVLHGISELTLGLLLMHRRLLPGLLQRWYRSVLLRPLLTGFPLVAASHWLMPRDLGRWHGLTWAGGTGAVLLAVALAGTSSVRVAAAGLLATGGRDD